MDPSTEALVLAARAEEKAEGAHDRLDRMNGSIDKLGAEVAATNAKIDSGISAIMARLDRQDGIEAGEDAAEERRSTRWGLLAVIATGAGTLASALTYAIVALTSH